MSLEAKLDKLTEVIEKLIAVQTSAKPAPAAETPKAAPAKADAKPAKAEKAPKAPTVEEVKDAVTAFAKKKDKAAAKALLAKFGAKDSASVAEDKRAAVIAACQAEDEESEEETTEDEDDL